LTGLGCNATFAADGGEALRRATETPFDLILMDIDLPDMSGIEIAGRLRANGCAARIVALSSYSRQEVGRMANDAQFDKYLYKPLTEADALAALASCPVTEAA
jgi:CheY-like chemotaxis protein